MTDSHMGLKSREVLDKGLRREGGREELDNRNRDL